MSPGWITTVPLRAALVREGVDVAGAPVVEVAAARRRSPTGVITGYSPQR